MNVDRAASQIGAAKAGEPRGEPKALDAKRPTFSLPHEEEAKLSPEATHQSTHRHVQSRAAEKSVPDAPKRTRAKDVESNDTPRDEATATQTSAAKPAEHPNAAARRTERNGGPSNDATDAGDTRAEASDAARAKPAAGVVRDKQQPSDDAASLPDRMLAMLSGDALPAALTSASSAAAPAVPPTPTLVSATPNVAPPALTLATNSQAPADSNVTAAGGKPGPTVAALAGAAPESSAATSLTLAPAINAGTDPFATLAALGGRERNTATVDGAPDSATSTFAPQLARGLDALQPATRAAVIDAPAALPLMLNADFDDGLGARVVWMAEQRIDHAQIRVSPEALGPIDIRLQLDGHRVTAQFHAANADVRQALESGMDRLRDMLGRQGMELGQAQVGSGSRQDRDGRATPSSTPGTAATANDAAGSEPTVTRVALLRSRGLLDEYA